MTDEIPPEFRRAAETTRERLHQLVRGAHLLAMRELGISGHAGTGCTDAACDCVSRASMVTVRAQELFTDDIASAADVCKDCGVLVPFAREHYGISGGVLCLPCGENYGLDKSRRLI